MCAPIHIVHTYPLIKLAISSHSTSQLCAIVVLRDDCPLPAGQRNSRPAGFELLKSVLLVVIGHICLVLAQEPAAAAQDGCKCHRCFSQSTGFVSNH